MKLILLCLLQGVLAVGGMGLLTQSLAGRALQFGEVLQGVLTVQGFVGIVLLLLSSVVMFFVLTFSKLSEYVPISTAAAYFFAVLYAVTFQGERISVPLILGMVLILGGIVIISSNK